MRMRNCFSPNFYKRKRSNKSIKIIVIHYTGMQSKRESIFRLLDPKSKVSSHYVICRGGHIYRLVKDNKIAWHAGKSSWGKFKNINRNSIGIELVNKGHKFGYTSFSKKQIYNLIKLCLNLIKRYKIKKKNIVGHSDIAPMRKIDPGEKFPWRKLAKSRIGIWHNCKPAILQKLRNVKVLEKDKFNFNRNISNIGYSIALGKRIDFIKTIKAFQRHYRKELINGILDKECLMIAKNLSKKL